MKRICRWGAALAVLGLSACGTSSMEPGMTSFPHPYDLARQADLPPLMTAIDGMTIDTPEQWREKRRPELQTLFRHYVYGYEPAAPRIFISGWRTIDREAFGGAGTLREVDLALGEEGDIILHLLMAVPNTPGPHPVFLYLNYCGNQAVIDHEDVKVSDAWVNEEPCGGAPSPRGHQQDRWPWEMMVKRGYAVATFHESDIDPDKDDFTDGVHARFAVDKPKDVKWGTIAAWAWGLSRAVDYLSTDPDINSRRIGVFGHSRRGKAALWATALDERIALAAINQSGTGGATMSRSSVGESVRQINEQFPHWFAKSFHAFNDREENLPIDQHQLLALVAPRPLMLNNAVEDTWADPEGSWRTVKEAQPAYELLGSRGLVQSSMDGFDPAAPVAFRMRPGEHSVLHSDWSAILDFADGQWRQN